MNRRKFLKLSAVGSVAATLTGCSDQPLEKMIPVLIPPPHYIPGQSIYYATTCRECTAACGLFVKTREGRAVKVEGNPHHPFNQGKACALGQASLQGLYSPARIKGPAVLNGSVRDELSWKEGIDLLVKKLKDNKVHPGQKLLYIGTPETGTMRQLFQNCLTSWGGGDYLELELSPVHSIRKANGITFGDISLPDYRLSHADTLINFGADFLESWLNPICLTREYTKLHAYQNGKKGKFIQVSPYLSLTGVNADRWYSCEPGDELILAFALAEMLLMENKTLAAEEREKLKQLLSAFLRSSQKRLTPEHQTVLNAVHSEFKQGTCICLSGGNSTASSTATTLHLAVNLINYISGAVNQSIVFGADYRFGGDPLETVRARLEQLNHGAYDVVIINNVNPVYALPQLPWLEAALKKTSFVVSLSTELDETSRLATLLMPSHHYLQSWGDGRPARGVYTLQQPVMSALPGYDTRETGDLLLLVSQIMNPDSFRFRNYQRYLQETWRQVQRENSIDTSFPIFWNSCLRQGGLYTTAQPRTVGLSPSLFSTDLTPDFQVQKGFTLLGINSNLQNGNGSSGNKTWLLETPHPVSQVAWDNWVDIHPTTANELGLGEGDLVELSSSFGTVQAATRLFYGIAPHTLAMSTGFGRSVLLPAYRSRKTGLRWLPVIESHDTPPLASTKISANVMSLFPPYHEKQSGDYLYVTEGVSIKLISQGSDTAMLDGQFPADITTVSKTRDHRHRDYSQKKRNLIRTVSLAGASQAEELPAHDGVRSRKPVNDFYPSLKDNVAAYTNASKKTPPQFFEPYKWEMVIDLDRCTGCSACVIACYAENNIAVVGKDRVRQGREMSWLRIERFYEKNSRTGKTETYLSPQMCAQCDNAGCEPVCPVSATYKTSDGINAMIYNRCIGSRYCSNNCIYSQRRFNWRTYHFPAPLHYQLNPSVAVRGKGVMEKCTFCQQKIREKHLEAKAQNRILKESELQTACQQTCPTSAIIFGNVNEPGSMVETLKSQTVRSYTQFESMNYQPAVTYLKKVLHDKQKA